MLENMFVGRPPGNYDRILDFSRAVTGNLFFVPSATFLENVADDQSNQPNGDQPAIGESPAATTVAETSSSISSPSVPSSSNPSSSNASVRDGSLGIGSLKGDTRHE
jgi:putative iron-dependent peroxidase